MKYISILISILLLLSCGNDKVTITKEEYNRLKGDTILTPYPKTINIVSDYGYSFDVYLGSDGHDYMRSHNSYGGSYSHYIECQKCNKRDSL